MTRAPGTRRPGPGLIPALPRQAWVVLGGDLISAVGSGLTLPCLFIYAHQVRHLSYGTAGLVVATIALASLAGNPAGGAAADRWTPRRALMAGLVLAATGSAALALAHTAAALFGAAGLLGLGVSVIWPAQDALLASVAGPAGLSAVFSVRHASLNAGLGLGALGAAAVVSVARPATFTVVYLADAATFLAFLPVLARVRPPAPRSGEPAPAGGPPPAGQPRTGVRQVLADTAFVRVWALTALLVTVSFGQFGSSFAGYATQPGGIGTRGLALAFAANTLTVVVAQLFVLRALAGRRRTTAAALAAAAWAASWAVVITGGHLGGGAAAEIAFAAAAVIFALGECLLAPTMPAIINDLAPPGAAGRYNGLGVLAFTTGFLLGPAGGGAALGVGGGTGLFAALVLACASAAVAALRMSRHLPPAANQIPAAAPALCGDAASTDRAEARQGAAGPGRGVPAEAPT
ncbi:MAG TPA: MFS transporter [Streptosporangiaceae bacterium]|nr:MFS transporter [Streptosporangiaceae bacterium]